MRWRILSSAIGGVALIALLAWFDNAEIGSEVLRASWAIPAIVALHLGQVFLSACAWWLAVGSPYLSCTAFFRLRLIREGVNSLLPVAQIGGQIVCIRLMAQRGLGLALASAGNVLDLTVETGMQLAFTILGIAMLAATGIDPSSVPWVYGGLLIGALAISAFVVAQRVGLLRVIEFAIYRLHKFMPIASVESLRGLHEELMRLQGRARAIIAACTAHLTSWSLGSVEVYLVLLAIGTPVGLPKAFVVESLGLAARSAGFALPGALGIQEGGFILVCGLFGVPPEAAIALSMVKRLREILLGIPGLMLWQWSEIKRRLLAGSNTGKTGHPRDLRERRILTEIGFEGRADKY